MKPIAIFLSVVLLFSDIYGRGNQNRIQQIENGYTFNFIFESTLPKDSLMLILFDFDHLVKYSTQISDMAIISREKDSYVVAFSIRYLFYSSESVYRRTLLKASNIVRIDMLKFTHNSSIVPKVLSSRVEYRLMQKNGKTEVVYNQECLFDKQVNWFYLKIIEGKLNESAEELQQYIRFLDRK